MKHAAVFYFIFLCTAFPQGARESAKIVQDFPAEAVIDKDSLYQDSSCNSEENFENDPDIYRLRKPSPGLIDKFRKDKEFNFGTTEEPTNLLEIISEWINEQILKLLRSKGFGIFQEYLSYIIAAAALLIVIIILNKNKLNGIVYGIEETRKLSSGETREDINKIDFDALISSCIAKKEYKIAARYYYLQCLKLLSDNKLIDWQINKTNRQYSYEIADSEIRKSFEELTNLFEWIWYGDYPLSESSFRGTQRNFRNFYGRLE